MGTYHFGWIEVNDIDRSEEDIWFGVVDISVLAEQTYDVYGELFGVRARDGVTPIAAGRGMPSGASENVKQDLGSGHLHGHTWIGCDELRRHAEHTSWSDLWGWRFVLDTMTKLQQQFGRNNVRLVVAFDS